MSSQFWMTDFFNTIDQKQTLLNPARLSDCPKKWASFA
jgi:hypothetical protein